MREERERVVTLVREGWMERARRKERGGSEDDDRGERMKE